MHTILRIGICCSQQHLCHSLQHHRRTLQSIFKKAPSTMQPNKRMSERLSMWQGTRWKGRTSSNQIFHYHYYWRKNSDWQCPPYVLSMALMPSWTLQRQVVMNKSSFLPYYTALFNVGKPRTTDPWEARSPSDDPSFPKIQRPVGHGELDLFPMARWHKVWGPKCLRA